MFEFTKQEKRALRDLGQTAHGQELMKVLERMKVSIMDVEGIPAGSEYGAEVEGRKIAKKYVEEVLNTMARKKEGFGSSTDEPDEEWT